MLGYPDLLQAVSLQNLCPKGEHYLWVTLLGNRHKNGSNRVKVPFLTQGPAVRSFVNDLERQEQTSDNTSHTHTYRRMPKVVL